MAAESSTQEQMKQTGRRGRRLKPRSEVWNHFTRVIGDDGKEKAKCNRCSIQYTIHGTKNQWKHLKECGGQESDAVGAGPAPDRPPQPLPLLPYAPSGSGASTGSNKPTLDEARQDLARMFALGGYDPSIVEDDNFRSFVRRLNPEFQVPSRHVLLLEVQKKHGLRIEEQMMLEKQRESTKEKVQDKGVASICHAEESAAVGVGAALLLPQAAAPANDGGFLNRTYWPLAPPLKRMRTAAKVGTFLFVWSFFFFEKNVCFNLKG